MFSLSRLQTITLITTAILLAYTIKYVTDNTSYMTGTASHTSETSETSMRASNILKATVSKATMSNATHPKIIPRRSAERGAADHGWLDTKHTFSFASFYDPRHQQYGSLRVLNEDRVAPGTGFPTHPHQNAEIFSYILSGELTHRDSMQKKGAESSNKDMFYRMKRGDVQFTTGGKGIAHSEQNEHDKDWVHFLQIWALPWKRGLPPTYHTSTFSEEDKRKGFVTIITPLKAGPKATLEDEKAAIPVKEGSIPVHADLVFSAGIIEPGKTFEYKIGGDDYVTSKSDRKTYVHLPATQGGKAKVKLANDTILSEGDGAYVSSVNAGDVLTFESVGTADAEIVVLDSSSA